MSIESVGSSASRATSTTAATGPAALGKNDFLKLLITQLRYQDPLNPLDQNQFLSQTAQFTSLEHLGNIATALDGLRGAATASNFSQSAALVGRTVAATGREVAFDGVSADLPFAAEASVGTVAVDVSDASGTLVRQLRVPASAGSVEWDGRDVDGNRLRAGRYRYHVSAATGPGRVTAASGVVDALELTDGRLVYRVGDAAVRQEDIVAVERSAPGP